MYQKYTQMPGPSSAADAPPPSYNQVLRTQLAPSAPPAPVAPMPMPAITQQEPHDETRRIYVHQGPEIPPLGPQPCLVTCPGCHQKHMSKIRYQAAMKTHVLAGAFCVLGLCCCACIPYFVDSCNNCNHYCSNCDTFLGMYK